MERLRLGSRSLVGILLFKRTMLQRRAQFLMLITLGVLGLLTLQMSRRPLCINSRIVERIDRVVDAGSEIAWRCSLNREVHFSAALSRGMGHWQSRVSAVEDGLARIQPFHEPIRLVILPKRPLAFRLSGRTLYVGESLLESPGVIERGIIKAWLRERVPGPGEDLYEEAQADLLQNLLGRDGGFGFPLEEIRWPQSLKGTDGYCQSIGRPLESLEPCLTDPSRMNEKSLTMGPRLFVARALQDAWKAQGLPVQLQALHTLPQWLSARLSEHPVKSPAGVVQSAMESVMSFHRALTVSATRSGSEAAVQIAASFLPAAQAAGFQEEKGKLRLDALILKEEAWNEIDRPLAERLIKFSRAYPSLKIAMKDGQNLRMMPAGLPLPLQGHDALSAERVAVLHCGEISLKWLLSFRDLTDHLFVIDSCKAHDPDLEAWILKGAPGFAQASLKTDFIEFHLPSLGLEAEKDPSRADLRRVIAKHDLQDPLLKKLGWQEVTWSKSLGAFRPKAFIDGIEWFRWN